MAHPLAQQLGNGQPIEIIVLALAVGFALAFLLDQFG